MVDQFKPGDIVKLKSGGPAMTVTQIVTTDRGRLQVWCKWFDDNRLTENFFPPEALEPTPAS